MKKETIKIIITALILFVIDAFLINQGAIALIAILIIVIWWLPKAVYKIHKKDPNKAELKKVLIYGCMAIAILSSNYINNKIAEKRATGLIIAIESFHKTTGAYPVSLSDLVPTYIQEVPKAKLSFSFNKFMYFTSKGHTFLSYTKIPPFGRPTYDFDRKKWNYID